MKTQLIATFLAASALATAHAQTSAVPAAGSGTSSSRARINTQSNPYAGVRGESIARYGSSYGFAVRRGNAMTPGSIILNSALPPGEFEELAEDLSVFTMIFNRKFDGASDKAAEVKLGVPITMAERHSLETTYIQGFGVIVKGSVPYLVAKPAETETKEKATTSPDSDWERAKRALYGKDQNAEAGPDASQSPVAATYNEALVNELKAQMFDALKNAANLRHVGQEESITVVITGDVPTTMLIDPLTGMNVPPANATTSVLTIRIPKSGAPNAESRATVAAYFVPTNGRGAVGFGGYGASSGYPAMPR
jgi:hypothetical protein